MTMTATRLLLDHLSSPIGTLLLVSDGITLHALDFHDDETSLRQMLTRYYGSFELTQAPSPQPVCTALRGYFDGDITALDRVRVAEVGTPFQRTVWSALRAVPYGTTTSYGAIAKQIGRPTASRAVGMANGANPISIVVPCHRVIGANASLTGYGGGLSRKAWLLEHEARHARTNHQSSDRLI
jgi:O-6-methylguanine DNA methyltransferase